MMIPEEIETSTSNEGFSMEYNFNERELKLLAKFFRCQQGKIPAGLEDFARKIELKIYSNMSIDEVEKFYS